MREACACGCGMPVGAGRKYLNNAHRQRAYNTRKRNKCRALSRYISGELMAMLGEEKANQCYTYLNQVATNKYNLAVDKALALILTTWKADREEASK